MIVLSSDLQVTGEILLPAFFRMQEDNLWRLTMSLTCYPVLRKGSTYQGRTGKRQTFSEQIYTL